jgi:hypothetical protein
VDYAKIESDAARMAAKAKPGILQHNNKVYTFVFDANEWIYKVYENGFFLVNFNTKSLAKAKTWLKDYLA